MSPSEEGAVARAIARYGDLLGAFDGANAEPFMAILLARDEVARAVRNSLVSREQLKRIGELDQMLKAKGCATLELNRDLEEWRSSANPDKAFWWWKPECYDHNRPVRFAMFWSAASVVSVAVVVGLLADFSHRLWNAGLDLQVPGTFYTVALQSIIALIVGGAMTASGRKWLDGVLGKIGLRRGAGAAKTALAVGLLLVTWTLWKHVPPHLAQRFNDLGYGKIYNNQRVQDFDAARRLYSQAISLDPENILAHYNLGYVDERFARYDEAIAEYERAITPTEDGKSEKQEETRIKAYAHLARVLIHAKQKYEDALNLTYGGLSRAAKLPNLDKKPEGRALLAELYANRGWALMNMNLEQAADEDFFMSIRYKPDSAASYCLLAKSEELQKRKSDAANDCRECKARVRTIFKDWTQMQVEPSWYEEAETY